MSDLSERVFGNELILSKILSSLTFKQLTNSCISVNQMWNRETQKVIRSRTEVQHYFELYRFARIRRHSNSISCCKRKSHCSENDPSIMNDCFEQIESKLFNKLEFELHIRPQLVITFFGNLCPQSQTPERLMQYNALRQYLPPESQLLNVISSAGIIGSVIRSANQRQNPSVDTSGGVTNILIESIKKSVVPIEAQAHVCDCAGISLIIFPKYPNVEIDVIEDRNLFVLEKLKSRNDLKCLVIFSISCAGDRHHFREFQCMNQLRNKYDNKIAIGGIITDEINFFSTNLDTSHKRSHGFYGIAFSGPNVRACSLHINTVTPEDTECKFRQFRQNLEFDPNLKTSETIAFMFISAGRGVYTKEYPTSNIEVTIFSKVFPNIKVVGVFGQTEYGHNYWPSITRQNQIQLSEELQEANTDAHELWHFYTSVVVLINLPKR